ncbi:sterol desaturase family protein [Colwellia psychrerythraea]|uniref:Fatty acid hydroxylase n=1 Tax=Colwellia psychrerythraea TaxID=28229 RepID=A0A099KT40_COLPS|nr:sterol desaturase family protein [Colwellia psychrerythraea]KGJ93939.1 fatty acid hydroxylase [Colwellia psychrerythraea]
MLDLRTDYLLLCLAFILLWEHYSPREVLNNVNKRWLNNFSIYLVSAVAKWAFILGLSVFFNYESTKPYLNLFTVNASVINILLFMFTIFALDLFSYTKHRLFHYYQILWRTHLVHHSDLKLDVTTNFRHHPFEQFLTYLIYAIFIFILALPVWAVAIYGFAASIMQLWQHSNTKLPVKIDHILRWLLITPSLHKLHHSAFKDETNSNYGTIFSCWDRFAGTLCEHQQQGKIFNYGLEYFRDAKQLDLWPTLNQPFNYKYQQLKSSEIVKEYNSD